MKIQLIFKLFILMIIFSNCGQAIGQNNLPVIERNVLDSLDSNFGYYLAVKPKSKKIKGAILLMPGLGQKAENVFRDSEFHQFAFEKNLLTIAYSTNMKLFADTIMQSHLNRVLSHVKSEYNISSDKFVLGGFSAGGNLVLRYAELCKQFPEKYPINPVAVFMADSPVDIFHSWDMMQELKKAANSEAAVNEANWVENMYLQNYGTTPQKNPNAFIPFNAFSFDKKYGNNEKYLKDVAVRAYHDVDISWRLSNRNQSVQHSNYLVSSELINRLLQMGNIKAEFIQSYQTGYRTNGNRHPHSWSIIDEKECIQWINKMLGEDSFSNNSMTSNENRVAPFLISKQSLSGLNLRRGRNPEQPNRQLYFQNIFRGEQLNVQIVSSENASASPENLEIDEFLFLTNGAARLSPKHQKEMTFLTDDFFLVPRGFNGEWETIGAPTFHHEISITTAQRNDSPFDPQHTTPVLMNKRKIAGLGITEISSGQYYDLLHKGHEITTILEGEKPQVREIKEPLPEQIIYIISGTLTLWDADGKEHHFVKGDFVVFPKGFIGTWQSKGQELFRTMKIIKSNW